MSALPDAECSARQYSADCIEQMYTQQGFLKGSSLRHLWLEPIGLLTSRAY